MCSVLKEQKRRHPPGAEHNWKAGTVEEMRSSGKFGGDQDHIEPSRLL